ncbi:MAG: DUF58 domain-containing protein [Salinibacterium sp.]|nr:DUF58 domain-containing protein [Salinibacterium sp.]
MAAQINDQPQHFSGQHFSGQRGAEPSHRTDAQFTTGTRGLTNARTRIVGERTGIIADLVVGAVRTYAAAWRVVLRASRGAASVITPLGWSILILVPLSLVLGYGLAWVEFIAIGFVGLLLILVALLSLRGRGALDIALDLTRSHVVVGAEAAARVVIGNSRRRRTFGVNVEVPVGAGLAAFALPSLSRGDTHSHEFAIPTSRRGRLLVGPVRTVRADPIGLIRREIIWTGPEEVFVHPRTIAIPSVSAGFVRDLEGNPTRDLSNSDVAFHALREYVPGDERRYIHWKSTARTGTYMVRQFEETRRSHLVVALSLATADYASDDEFELAVSAAGSLGARAIRDARSVTVVASEFTPDYAKRKVYAVKGLTTVTRVRLLDDLALVEQAESALTIGDVARVTADQVSGVSVAFLICGSTVTPKDLRAASTKFEAGVEVVAVICDPQRIPGLRRVARLSVLTIGFLEDLQKSLARIAAA